MRVLQLGAFPPPFGGVQTNLVAIRDALREHGHQAGVINLTRNRRDNADEVYFPHTALETARLILSLPYDILHLHIGGMPNLKLWLLSLFCCWLPGKRAVLTFHSGGYPSSPVGQAARWGSWRGFIFRQFDAIIAVNPEIEKLFHRYGVAAQRVITIRPDAVDRRRMAPALSPRLQSFFDQHQPTLVTVGLLEPEYDLETQIAALGGIREQAPRAGLLIIGSGSLEPQLKAAIAAQPWAEHILLAGDVPHGETLRAIADADFFLRTTLYDGDAVSIREALFLGTRVLATDNGLRPPGVDLVPHSDPAALARILLATQPDPARLAPADAAGENMGRVLDLYRGLTSR